MAEIKTRLKKGGAGIDVYKRQGLIKDGSLVACMAQNPDVMGKMGMDAAVAAVKGEPIPETNVDTGVSVLTKDSIQ